MVVGQDEEKGVDPDASGGAGDEGHHGRSVGPMGSEPGDFKGGKGEMLRGEDGGEAQLLGGLGHPLKIGRL